MTRARWRWRAGTRRAASSAPSAYVRDNFFAARKFTDLDDLNVQAEAWCRGLAADRRCPGQDTVSVREAFAAEAPRLLALPDNPYPLIERVAVKAGKTPYVRFDLNDYSIPHTKVQRLLTVLADPNVVRIVDDAQVLACHRRSYDKGAQIEDAGHVQALVQHKRAARRHRGTDHLAKAAPESQTLLLRAAERGDNLGTVTAALLRLLERYGAAELDAAIREAIERGVPHPNAVRLALDHRRELRDQPPPVAVILPEHVKVRDAHVRPHRLRQINARSQYRPSGTHPRSHRAVHQRRSAAWRARRARQRFCPAPTLASLCRPPSSGDRRGRISLLFQSPCRPAVRTRQPPLRAQQHARHHQQAIRRMARGFSKRRLRRLPGRSPGTQRRGPRHRGRILSPQGGPRTIRAARTPTTQSQVMSKDSTGLPLTISLKIPAYWTPEQAFAVVELLDDLRDRIWAHYGVQLLDQYRDQYGPADSDHTDLQLTIRRSE